MTQQNINFTPETLRLLGAALALQQHTSTAANLIPIPNTGRFIAIGTPAEVARLLEIAPAPDSIGLGPRISAVIMSAVTRETPDDVFDALTAACGRVRLLLAQQAGTAHDHSEGGHHD